MEFNRNLVTFLFCISSALQYRLKCNPILKDKCMHRVRDSVLRRTTTVHSGHYSFPYGCIIGLKRWVKFLKAISDCVMLLYKSRCSICSHSYNYHVVPVGKVTTFTKNREGYCSETTEKVIKILEFYERGAVSLFQYFHGHYLSSPSRLREGQFPKCLLFISLKFKTLADKGKFSNKLHS
jgi:hypothetical protein